MSTERSAEDGRADDDGTDDGTPDPYGRSVLFGDPLPAAGGPGGLLFPPSAEGRDALWSEGPRRSGTVVIECSSCDVRTRVAWAEAGVRLASLSVLNPLRRHPHRLTCPACAERTWCRIDWTG